MSLIQLNDVGLRFRVRRFGRISLKEYLLHDDAATTPVDPRVVRQMLPYLTEMYGDPASRSHAFGWAAEEAVEIARGQVASLINADPREIVWTSGATESNNLAIKGAAHFHGNKGKHLVTLATEHKAVLDTMRELEREGFEVTVLPVQESGLVDPAAFEAALTPGTILASVMLVKMETGVIQDIAALGALCRARAACCSSSTRRRRPARCRSTWRRCRWT